MITAGGLEALSSCSLTCKVFIECKTITKKIIMKTLNKSQREVLTEKLIELIEAKARCWKLIMDTKQDESLTEEHKQSMITLWDLDIHLNDVQIDEIKSLLTNNEF